MRRVAALFVEARGAYTSLPHVDPWPEVRDARKYGGPWPVVAHPPCSRWCRLAGLVEARWGHKRGEDGECFASALASLRAWGGVLEHPAYSDAWKAYGLPRPPTGGGVDTGRASRGVDLLRGTNALRTPGQEGYVALLRRDAKTVSASIWACLGSTRRRACIVVRQSCRVGGTPAEVREEGRGRYPVGVSGCAYRSGSEKLFW